MKKVIAFAAIVVLSFTFAYAGLIKAIDPDTFYHDIGAYHLVSDQAAWLMSHMLPWLELVLSVSILFRLTRAAASLLMLILLIIFSGAIISSWLRGLDIGCGCFGHSEKGSYVWVVGRDLLMAIATGFLLHWNRAERLKDNST